MARPGECVCGRLGAEKSGDVGRGGLVMGCSCYRKGLRAAVGLVDLMVLLDSLNSGALVQNAFEVLLCCVLNL